MKLTQQQKFDFIINSGYRLNEQDQIITPSGKIAKITYTKQGNYIFTAWIDDKLMVHQYKAFVHYCKNGTLENKPRKNISKAKVYDNTKKELKCLKSLKNDKKKRLKRGIDELKFDIDIKTLKLHDRAELVYGELCKYLYLENDIIKTKSTDFVINKDFILKVNGKNSFFLYNYIKYYMYYGEVPTFKRERTSPEDSELKVIAVINDDCFSGGKLEIRNVDLNDKEFRAMLIEAGYSVEWFLTK